MVLLTMTPAIVDGLHHLQEMPNDKQEKSEPNLLDAAIGNAISHKQILDLWKRLQDSQDYSPLSLEALLRGAHVYCPPPPAKPEPSAEYKALMLRLRREEDERAYERMINPVPRLETFKDRFPHSASSYEEVNRPSTKADLGDDDVTLNDVHRQVMLILNFLVSILGVAGTLWVLGRWWSTPARIFLTMGGSILVGIAEVAVYSAYMWRMDQAHKKNSAKKEVKQVVQTWLIGEHGEKGTEDKAAGDIAVIPDKEDAGDGALRKRHVNSATSEAS